MLLCVGYSWVYFKGEDGHIFVLKFSYFSGTVCPLHLFDLLDYNSITTSLFKKTRMKSLSHTMKMFSISLLCLSVAIFIITYRCAE